jgi:preprotein translocase subunit YajC
MMWTDAWAQAAGASQPSDPMISTLLMLLQFLPIFLILYFLIIRPQQQQKKKAMAMLAALKKGDRVLTNGGMFGTIVGLEDDKAVLKVAENIKVEFLKSAIVQVIPEG